MPHLPFRSVLAALALSAPAAGAQVPAVPVGDIGPFSPESACIDGVPEPITPFLTDRPPVRVAHCAYSRAELVERFARLLESKAPRLTLESVERMFGLPLLVTSYPDPLGRSAWYNLRLRGGQGGDEWIAFVNFREGHYPHYDFRPPRMKGSERPTPIDPDDHGDILFSLGLYEDAPKPGSPKCIPVLLLYDRALGSGWRDDTESSGYVSHEAWKSVVLRRGDMTYFPAVTTERFVATRDEIEATCFNRGEIRQEPTKPEPPLSADEQALIDRRYRERQAGAGTAR